jgi:hypothetical protein
MAGDVSVRIFGDYYRCARSYYSESRATQGSNYARYGTLSMISSTASPTLFWYVESRGPDGLSRSTEPGPDSGQTLAADTRCDHRGAFGGCAHSGCVLRLATRSSRRPGFPCGGGHH